MKILKLKENVLIKTETKRNATKIDYKTWHALWKCTKKAKIIAIYQKKCEKGEALWKDKSILGGAK